MFRWYDYWIKGIDNGIMDEPAVQRLRRGLARGGHRRAVAAEGRRVPVAVPAPAPQALRRARADGRRARRPGRLLPGAADGDRQGRDPQLEHRAVRRAHRDDRHRRRAPLRRDRPARHQLHPAPVGRGPERQASADHHRLPQGLAPRARRAHHRGQPVPPAHPRRAGRAGDDRGVRAAPLPVRGDVPARATGWSWSSPTTSRWSTSTTRCCRRTPSTCRWAGPSPTRSTATPPTRPGSCCRSPRKAAEE